MAVRGEIVEIGPAVREFKVGDTVLSKIFFLVNANVLTLY
jgi:D-arabinose 1-dehydrogenase-like Zn-dependent alcohol dehydrogenase